MTKRQRKINMFLQDVLSNPDIRNSDIMKEFLIEDSPENDDDESLGQEGDSNASSSSSNNIDPNNNAQGEDEEGFGSDVSRKHRSFSSPVLPLRNDDPKKSMLALPPLPCLLAF